MAKRQALGLIVKNGRSEAIRVMAARLFLQVRVEPWVREEKSVEGKHPDDPEAIVIQGDEMLRAFRLPEAKVLLEKSKTLLPKLNDPMRRARLESITISDLAALADTQQRWATASQAEISVERQGISALREKALIYFKGDPYVKHDTRPSTMPSVPIGADAVVEAIKDRSCDMDDADLEYLKKMPNLRVLDLCWSSHMTGAGLQSIQDANSLRKLYLPQSIKDGDLKWLRGLTELEELAIGGPGITDEGIRQVVALRNLESLHLSGERITEKAIEHLRALKRLSRLSLTQTAITDAGLKQLAEIKSLKALNLGWTQIGDAGLEHLAGLVRLEQLSVNNTRVTDRGVKKLQQSLPNCGIVISCGLAGSESCPR
jgi:Leucine-rich repeat (LRR) protein